MTTPKTKPKTPPHSIGNPSKQNEFMVLKESPQLTIEIVKQTLISVQRGYKNRESLLDYEFNIM